MRIFITGVSCVGKTTVGRKLATLCNYSFFDLDEEIEKFFGESIERLQNRCLTMYSYRKEASRVLKHLLLREDSRHCVIALPPSGLMDSYWKVVKAADGLVVVLQDRPENILKRITFYDIDSRPIQKNLTEREKHLYLQEIKKDIAYFARTYRRADLTVDIADLGPDEAARKVQKAILARTSAL